ncbi:MAG: GWxTD domain-containing protein [Gemmatimonadota bacterium]
MVTDTVALLSLERATIDRARADRNNPLVHLELGFIALRLSQLTASRDHAEDAGSEFEWATELAPDWPVPWYGLGEAEMALRMHPFTPTVTLNRLRRVLDVDEASRAVADQRRALRIDPGFAPAILALTTASIADDDESGMLNTLHTAWAAASTTATTSPDYWQGRGIIEEYLARSDSALPSFRRYIGTGGDSALGFLHQARLLFDLGRQEEGDSTYFRAARLARSAVAIALLRQDLSYIATEAELSRFDTLSAETREIWVRTFWTGRDLEAGRMPGERLAEHYHRYFYALRHFRRRGTYWQTDRVLAYHSDQTLFDDRGVIYLRHGEPNDIASYLGEAGFPPNISWKYRRPDSSLIFHFRPQGDPRAMGTENYRLVESLLDISSDPEFLASRGGLDPIYDMLAAGQSTTGRLAQMERERGYDMIKLGTSTDSYQLQFPRGLAGIAERYALSGAADEGTVLLVFAVPVRELATSPASDLAQPRLLKLHATATNANGGYLIADSTWTVRPDAFRGSDASAVATLPLPLPPGNYRMTLVATIDSGHAGMAQRWEDVVVPSRGAFGLSDLVLGSKESGITWVAGADTVALNPLNRFAAGSEMLVYYQLIGATPNSLYRTRITIMARDEKPEGKRQIDIAFNEPATRPLVAVSRSISLAGAAPGGYRMTVTVTGPDERSVSRQTWFEIDR